MFAPSVHVGKPDLALGRDLHSRVHDNMIAEKYILCTVCMTNYFTENIKVFQ